MGYGHSGKSVWSHVEPNFSAFVNSGGVKKELSAGVDGATGISPVSRKDGGRSGLSFNRICHPKHRDELALLSWNTNGRLDLRGCREGLIRSWAKKGFVNMALVQETLNKNCSSLVDMFGPDWRNISSWAVSRCGRGSGGCTIFGQPSLVSKASFMKKGGRFCGYFVADGLY